MGQYSVELVGSSREDLRKIYKSGNKAIIKKIEDLFMELSEHPYTGTGKPEPLKYLPNMWSRRLDKKNRLLYTINEDVVSVYVVSVLGHYTDK
ncbi:addiction module toxin, Txe/YoeB family [Prevotella sp. DNF00663]|uniref:Txe/YoeB family addiction module toxin n=1 Tax=Prevotella sp. DNF00663 TaxID=1384078 RepID=UPI0007837079|nr:Txe/YoeB family addiction module toxin [Prevotella sp. DNF00663]KXB79076.1 addiction module toxin, Txe/YoeB family [Prevotella sp. DNF00663]